MPPVRKILAVMLGLFLCAAPFAAAHAHAIILSSEPAVNAVVKGQAATIVLHFNSRIDQRRSKLTLVAPDQSKHVLAALPEKDPDIMRAEAPDLKEGAYRLRWQVLSVDGHITRGDIPFTVHP